MDNCRTRIYLIRHGETEFNNLWRYQGLLDHGLNENGQAQALALGTYFAQRKVDAIYASNLKRALETAKPIAEIHNLPINTEERLKEMDFGLWEGLSFAEIEADFPDLAKRWLAEPHLVTIPQGETFVQVGQRAAAAFRDIADKHRGQSVVIVAHGGVNRLILCDLFGLDYCRLRQFKQDNGAVTIIDSYDNIYTLSLANYRPS
ncbi:MAG: alpha-ribazole phosphatase [Bacillota bacterium]|jgi:alpha-ribazole phosphatase